MDIYIEKIDSNTGEATHLEQILTATQALALAKVFSSLLPELRRIDNPEVQYLATEFFEYIQVDSDLYERTFTAFCDEAAVLIQNKTPDDAHRIRPDDFDPDARSFLGRLLFSGEIITPAIAHQITPFLGMFCGLLSQYHEQARQERSEIAMPLRFAYQTINAIAAACDNAIEQSSDLRIAMK